MGGEDVFPVVWGDAQFRSVHAQRLHASSEAADGGMRFRFCISFVLCFFLVQVIDRHFKACIRGICCSAVEKRFTRARFARVREGRTS